MPKEIQQPLLEPDELEAIQGSKNPSQSNVLVTENELETIGRTKSKSWSIGEITDTFYTFFANITSGENKPGIRYNKITYEWEFSNEGSLWTPIKTGSHFFNKITDTTDDITEGIKKFLTDDSVEIQHLNSYNSPEDGYLLTWDTNENKFKWVNPLDLQVPQDTTIGTPTDGTYTDGLLDLQPTMEKADAFDEINEILKEIAPNQPLNLSGDITLSTSLVAGKIAGGTSISGVRLDSYYEGLGISNIYATNNLITSIPDFGKADKGLLKIYLNSNELDTFDLGLHFDEDERDTVQSYTPKESLNKYFNILNVQKYNNFKRWQQGQADLQIGSIYGNDTLSNGEQDIQIKHFIDGSLNGETSISKIFIDKEQGRPLISITPSITQNIGVYRYLSGVKLYTLGSSFNVSFEATKCFEYTYLDTPLEMTMQGMNDINISIQDSSISGITLPTPKFNETIICEDKEISLNKTNIVESNTRVNIIPKDPHGNGISGTSISENRIINTYSNLSSEIIEYFVDEYYRLPIGDYNTIPSNITEQWNSINPLEPGNAQVFNHYLRFPKDDYTIVLPNQILDYSGFSGNQVYIRAFKEDWGHQSGNLIFSGISLEDMNTNIKIEIKLPSQTGWLDLGKAFNVATFTGADGDGCRVYSDGGNFGWTCGTFSTANSGKMIIVKITLLNDSKTIYQINSSWN